MTAKPVFTPNISFGNLIQTAALIVAMAGGYFMLEARSQQNKEQIEEMRTLLSSNFVSLDTRIRGLEIARARDDERFSNILQFMARIDTRLERIEQKGSGE